MAQSPRSCGRGFTLSIGDAAVDMDRMAFALKVLSRRKTSENITDDEWRAWAFDPSEGRTVAGWNLFADRVEGYLINTLIAIGDRVADLEAVNDRRETWEQEQNERR